jgi:hypothetical protein
MRSILVIALLCLVWIGLTGPFFHFNKGLENQSKQIEQSEPGNSELDADKQALEKRVNFHRIETGRKLNRERINVEFENVQTAPEIPFGTKVQPQIDMMRGVPLAAEAPHRTTSRDRLVPVNPDFSDARTQYSLQEQQAAQEYEQLARKKYVDEFVANAAKEGYKVRVEPNGQVTVLGRLPTPGKSIGTIAPAGTMGVTPTASTLPQ